MKLTNETYEYIKEEVINLFERYAIRCVPISGFEIATKMGVRLVSYSVLSEQKRWAALKLSPDGFFWEPGDGREYIFYNDSVDYERTNMTILHELGHDVLGHYEGMSPDVMEAEAAFFAKYAAAPPPLVHCLNLKSPKEISVSFRISYTAALNALNYYRKWLCLHQLVGNYSPYELRLLNLFQKAA